MGKLCLGDFYTHRKCKLSNGGAVTVKSAGCKFCKEQRCKSHCKCQGTWKAEGRNAPRTRKGSASSATDPGPALALARGEPTAPQASCKAAPAPPCSVKAYDGPSWIGALVKDILNASSIDMLMYTFDDDELWQSLVAHLKRGRGLRVVLDEQYLESRPKTHGKLRILQKADAELFVKSGLGRKTSTSMHKKITVLTIAGNPVIYYGSANATYQSRRNDESVLRLTGHENCKEILPQVADSLSKAKPYKP